MKYKTSASLSNTDGTNSVRGNLSCDLDTVLIVTYLRPLGIVEFRPTGATVIVDAVIIVAIARGIITGSRRALGQDRARTGLAHTFVAFLRHFPPLATRCRSVSVQVELVVAIGIDAARSECQAHAHRTILVVAVAVGFGGTRFRCRRRGHFFVVHFRW
jgi:stage V sporulation protein SpoVS